MSRLIAGFAVISILAGCTTGHSYHGMNVDRDALADVEAAGSAVVADIKAQFGTPSLYGLFDDNTLIYMSSYKRHSSVFRDKSINRDISVLKFNDADALVSVRNYDMDDGRKIAFAAQTTPTQGRRANFFEQLFGAIGFNLLGSTSEDAP